MAMVIYFAYSKTESLKSWLNQLAKVLEIIARLQQNDDDNPPPVVPARYKEPDALRVVNTCGPDVALDSEMIINIINPIWQYGLICKHKVPMTIPK